MNKSVIEVKSGSQGVSVDIDSPIWSAARSQITDLKMLLGDDELTKEVADTLAKRWGTSIRTVWRRARAFRSDASVRAILPRQRGVRAGIGRLNAAIEDVITRSARDWWKKTENATIAEIFPTICRECKARELDVPSRATVARRLAVLKTDPSNFSGDVASKLRERTRLVKASYHVGSPLAVVQVDHTIADVFVVDPVTRACIGRPTLTIAIDVATRCVLGFCLSLEAPSSLLVALCLEHAVFPKEAWLTHLGFNVDWPMHGQPSALHVDNGREFHSAAFRRGCDLNGIDTIYRPPATPRFGGHIERMIGTLMRHVRLLPGNTFSDLLKERPSRAETRATLTLGDLAGYLTEDIGRYHNQKHRSLGMSPKLAWEQAWARSASNPKVPADSVRFRREFLPVQYRVVGREGIELFGLKYSCEALAAEVHSSVRRTIRFDPRDLSHVYLERSGTQPLVVPLRDAVIPPMSVWEWKSLRKSSPQLSSHSDGSAIRTALHAQISEAREPSTKLRSQRRAARKAAWQEVQRLHELPLPDTTLQTTISSTESGSLSWEILE